MIFTFVYTSVLAPMADVRSVANIVRKSRSSNLANGLTGVLAFDGERFLQYIEGEEDAVRWLVARISTDPRHQQLRILHQGFIGEHRLFGEWSMAYALDTEGTVLQTLGRARGPHAVIRLQEYLPRLEHQPDSA